MDFNSAAELRAHYKALRARTNSWREPPSERFVTRKIEPAYEPNTENSAFVPRRSLKEIFLWVCHTRRLPPVAVVSVGRQAALVDARAEFCYLACKETLHSYTKIGKFINRDHSTVMWAVEMFSTRNALPHPRIPIHWESKKASWMARRDARAAARADAPIQCRHCGCEVIRKRLNQQYCSQSCRHKERDKRRGR